jgi:LuxR family transcriptional regulator, quorum-sensing system regulator BjaR1
MAEIFGQEAFQFIDELDSLSTADAVADAMKRATARFGFEGLFIGGHKGHPSLSFNEIMLATKCPPELQAIYHSRGYIHEDPIFKSCVRSSQPFAFHTSNYGPEDGPRAPEIMSLLEDFGITQGFIIPIHGPDGYEGAVGMVGDQLDLSGETKPGIHLMAVYAVDRLRELVLDGFDSRATLTAREREVLAWSAKGKTAWEIGEILNIAKRTVDEHAQTAIRKLGAANRTQAVALAIRDRMLDI